MKKQDTIIRLQRNISQTESSRRTESDPESFSVVIVIEGGHEFEQEELVPATLTFHGSRGGKCKTIPFKVLEKLLFRIGGSVLSLPDNHRNDL